MWTWIIAAPARSQRRAVSTSSSSVVGSAGKSALAVSAPVGATVIRVSPDDRGLPEASADACVGAWPGACAGARRFVVDMAAAERMRDGATLAEARRRFAADVVTIADDLFQGDLAELVCQLVRARDFDEEELARVMALLGSRERAREGGTS